HERRRDRPLSQSAFFRRVGTHAAAAALLVLVSLGVGMAGYSHFERLPWRDAFLNSAMLLGGMGPVETPATPARKVFAGLYALYAGLIFLVVAGIVLAPVVHRLLHQFHWEKAGDSR